jgi:hypothetical protein
MGRYEVVQREDRTCFVVQPASAPFPLALGFFCVIGLLWMVRAENFVFPALFLGLFLVALLIRWKGPGAARNRKKTSFEVTPAGITISGGEIHRDGIHRLILRNHISGAEQDQTSSSPVLVGGMTAVAGAVGRNYGKKLARVSWRLDVDARGQAYTLAGGLDETTAYGLMSDVERSLKGDRPTSAPASSAAGFCAKCGAALTTGAGFCAKCGAPRASAPMS